jgi:hypothetical protein
MKKYSFLEKTIAVLSAGTLLLAAFPQKALSQSICVGDSTVPPVAPATCGCNNALGCDPLDSIIPYGSYHKTVDASTGSMGIIWEDTDTGWCYYDSAFCEMDDSYWNLLKCIAAAGAEGLCIVECVGGGGSTCEACVLLAGNSIACCSFCAWHTCSAPSSNIIHHYVYRSHGDGDP